MPPRPAPPAALLVALVVAGVALGACSSRRETPVPTADSTWVYPSKAPDGVEATITFCTKVGSKSGKRYGIGQTFTLGEDEKVRALVDVRNASAPGGRPLSFHLAWVGPGDREFYTKRLEIVPEGPEATLESAISIPPGRRDPGEYSLRVYLFRERIAEKRFTLVAAGDGAA